MAGVEIDNLSKHYQLNDKVFYALQQITMTIPDGSITAIVGKSGCGKTTLLRLLAGLEEKSAGDISFAYSQTDSVNHRVGMVFQEHRLMPWLTVRENMAFSLKADPDQTKAEQTVTKYLTLLGLAEFQNAYPGQLSGGMAQRTALGRTLCYDPDLILMDEPFGALDYFTRKNLQREIVDLFLTQKKTIVFVTHDVTEAVYLGQKVIVMDSGKVVCDIPVDLPYHREANSAECLAIQQEILSCLGGQTQEGPTELWRNRGTLTTKYTE
ncbi:ABC transporter ATP-binding protein [Anaerosporomusa subterranea]|uniref:ABC transporter ATP-binding protein n=1 Tax=Anaerosporomusa subterranea TaxID=1794912 RepID=UPI000825441D|nr:ABC transporter ATP-binding protein [Anaerosporomusa subterranea]